MTRFIPKLFLAFLLVSSPTQATESTSDLSLTFDENRYEHKWSSENLHEFTPQGQSVTGRWSNMLTVNFYDGIHDEQGLADIARQVLGNYEEAGGIIMGVETLDGSGERPAEFLMSVVFGAEDIAEIAYVKFRIDNGQGTSVAYAHREYGTKIGTKIDRWLSKNGKRVKQELVEFDQFPSTTAFQDNDTLRRQSDLELAI